MSVIFVKNIRVQGFSSVRLRDMEFDKTVRIRGLYPKRVRFKMRFFLPILLGYGVRFGSPFMTAMQLWITRWIKKHSKMLNLFTDPSVEGNIIYSKIEINGNPHVHIFPYQTFFDKRLYNGVLNMTFFKRH